MELCAIVNVNIVNDIMLMLRTVVHGFFGQYP